MGDEMEQSGSQSIRVHRKAIDEFMLRRATLSRASELAAYAALGWEGKF